MVKHPRHLRLTCVARRRRTLHGLVFAVVAIGSACSTGRVTTGDIEGDTLKVMSFNIWHDHDWQARQDLVVAAIRDASPDVAGLQEALTWQLAYLVERLPVYDYVGVGRDDGSDRGESVGILFRKDRFDVAASGTFWLSDDPETPGSIPGASWGEPTLPRVSTWLRLVDKSSGRGVYVYNVHFQHDAGADPELARTNSAALLLEKIGEHSHNDPVIVTGDFNATASEAPIRHLTTRGPFRYCPKSEPCRELSNGAPLLDSWAVLHDRPSGGTRCFDSNDSGRRIDYVFVSPGSRFSGYDIGRKIDGACPSDHHYVSVTVAPWH